MDVRSVGFFFLLLVAACDSDDETASPTTFDPFGPSCTSEDCRGDPTGEWVLASACAIDAEVDEPDDCPGFSCQLEVTEASGSYDFGADGMASFDWGVTLSAVCKVPKSCFVEASCADLDTAERSCSDAGDHCACAGVYPSERARAGTWNIESGLLSIEDGSGMTATSNWCVVEGAMAINVLASFDGRFGSLLGAAGPSRVRLTLNP
jgi:hypothetical protein